EGHELATTTRGLMKARSELEGLDRLGAVEHHGASVVGHELAAVGPHPEWEELGQLRVEAEARDVAAVNGRELLVELGDCLPVAGVDILDRQPGLFERRGVDDHQDHVVELGDAVDAAVHRDWLRGGGAELAHVYAGIFYALVDRL